MTTLTDIDAAFDGLSEEHRILLLDHLADRLGLELDVQATALDYARGRFRDEDVAAEYADRLIPAAAERDRTLAYALRDKVALGRAA